MTEPVSTNFIHNIIDKDLENQTSVSYTHLGTSVAAAVTAGATALIMEWAVVDGNIPAMGGDLIKSLLISGCAREGNLEYPNIKWGYGKLDLLGTFTTIKETIVNYKVNLP